MGRKLGFTPEEQAAAVKLVTEGGRTAQSVANEYGIHENTVYKWIRQYKANPEQAFKQSSDAQPEEIRRMQRRIQELENEVAFLKKVHAYFAKPPRQSMR
jgi:transposase